ncbi:S49 family peptidase [Marinobacter salicampi]|uniref:S49 family peptidase n=1 Tax=Marinobacter salicampi TaxID=435907 RepID=UPI00140CB8F8|nr:S49 family peptidase [Marinobacter salicampi]
MSDWESDKKPGWGVPTASDRGETSGSDNRDRKLIEKLVMSLQSEQRKSRRWGIFFKLLTFAYLFAILFMLLDPFEDGLTDSVEAHTAVIEVDGPIADDTEASADYIVGGLREAFESTAAKAVILRINSPGGSPVQSGYVYDEIKRLRDKHPDKKLYAVISDIGASGAYYIAAAADEIYANEASLVGSIGVVSGGFGFTGVMDKLGVERRLYTSGENKGFLDPFSPEEEEEVDFWKEVLETTHQQFISQVKAGRGERLSDDPKLFTGLIWTGEQALGLGLIDGIGSTSFVAREIVGHEELVDYTRQASPFQNIIDRFGVAFGAAIADQLMQSRLELR